MKTRTLMAYAGLATALAVTGCKSAQDYTSKANGDAAPATKTQVYADAQKPGAQGYQVQEIGSNAATADKGPVRLARVSYMKGPVSWRPTQSAQWSGATVNLPLRQGATVWVKPSSRCELQFDDGSVVRLGGGAICSLQTLYSDDHGEFTEVTLNDGLATFNVRNKLSEYQVDTPLSAVKAYGPANVRVGVGHSVEVACRTGNVDIEGKQGSTDLHQNQMCDIANASDPYRIVAVPTADPWDDFNRNRDVVVYHRNRHVPQDIDLVAGDLDDYGTWHDDAKYGYVWAPSVHEAAWRPYHNGHWVWVSPWGWTWVGDEDWGWAPYHYGTWVDESYGWAWAPGPAVQYWSPAVVDFVNYDPYYGWVPLAPAEVRYPPAIDIGFHSGDWWLDFSIGGAAAFFPVGPTYCEPRPWDNAYCNRSVNIFTANNFYGPRGPQFFSRSRFFPRNATRFSGMTLASRQTFFNGGRFQSPRADPTARFFRNGRSFASMPRSGQRTFFGPPSARPHANSFTASRTFNKGSRPTATAMHRGVFRAGLPRAVASRSTPLAHSFTPTNHRARVVRGNVARGPQPGINPTNRSRIANQPRRNSPSMHAKTQRGPVANHRPTITNYRNRRTTSHTPVRVNRGRTFTPHVNHVTPRTPQHRTVHTRIPVRHVQLPPRGFQQRRVQTPKYHLPERTYSRTRTQTVRRAPQHSSPARQRSGGGGGGSPRQHGGGGGGGGHHHGH